ncbi:hypothetical protein F5890DRAFT_1471737 [Lentinula detonsa]|uniref:Fungal-type protein kinase domain-containing protein n=1 Tax=Lentinula detonsa TaxID=2804962 RepID=A0AA38Q7S9_9AGAR|nr:hypothetical protein F5890DRAFT_1471737 [Lentinula detonsa]
MSSEKGDTAQVTIHQSGGREKILEVGTSQYYERKAEEEFEEEEDTKLTPTQGQRHTRVQYLVENEASDFFLSPVRLDQHRRSRAAEALHAYEKFGFIPNLHLDDFDYLRDPKQFVQDSKNNPEGLVGVKYRFKCSDGCRRLFVIKRVLYRAEGIIGRGSIANASAPSLISTVQGRLKSHLKEKYEERVMRVASLGKPHPLSELEDPRDFAQVFYDILQIFGNIMFQRKDDKICDVLNDFDLSSRVQDIDKDPSSNHRTSTRPFMSTELLNPAWKGGHYYRHDLESLFYTMLCIACRYERPGAPAAEPRAYPKRFYGSDEEVRDKKHFFSNQLSSCKNTNSTLLRRF